MTNVMSYLKKKNIIIKREVVNMRKDIVLQINLTRVFKKIQSSKAYLFFGYAFAM